MPQKESVRRLAETVNRKFGIKVSPTDSIESIVDIIKEYPISFVTCCNGLQGLILENEEPVVTKILGGVGGRYIKPFCLSMVYKLSKEIDIPILGCGGISEKQDIQDYMKCGASGVQVGTHYYKNGISIFKDLFPADKKTNQS